MIPFSSHPRSRRSDWIKAIEPLYLPLIQRASSGQHFRCGWWMTGPHTTTGGGHSITISHKGHTSCGTKAVFCEDGCQYKQMTSDDSKLCSEVAFLVFTAARNQNCCLDFFCPLGGGWKKLPTGVTILGLRCRDNDCLILQEEWPRIELFCYQVSDAPFNINNTTRFFW